MDSPERKKKAPAAVGGAGGATAPKTARGVRRNGAGSSRRDTRAAGNALQLAKRTALIIQKTHFVSGKAAANELAHYTKCVFCT